MPQLVAVAVRGATGTGPVRLVVSLRPEELGRLDIAVERLPDGPTRIHVLAERPETLELLLRDAGMLSAALQQVGLGANAGHDLRFGLSEPATGQDPGSAGQGGQGGGHPSGGQRRSPHPHPATASPPARGAARGLLDIAL